MPVEPSPLHLRWSSGLVALPLLAQVIEGESEIVNLRETNGRLGSLIVMLIVLGAAAIVGTLVFWWLTRPTREQR